MSFTQNNAQNLPYYQIPEAPDSYTATAVVSRMIDGLGFRYYWATEGLRKEDLTYRPASDIRSMEENLNHILGLTDLILSSAQQKAHEGKDHSGLSFEEKRSKTLNNIKTASELIRNSNDLSQFNIEFKTKTGSRKYPFWNQINGPIADAIWHCGQVVSYRRLSGNPINSKASMLNGKLRD